MSFNQKEAMTSQYSVKITPEVEMDSYPFSENLKIAIQSSSYTTKHYFSAEFTLYSSAKDANQVCHYRQTLMALIIKFK